MLTTAGVYAFREQPDGTLGQQTSMGMPGQAWTILAQGPGAPPDFAVQPSLGIVASELVLFANHGDGTFP